MLQQSHSRKSKTAVEPDVLSRSTPGWMIVHICLRKTEREASSRLAGLSPVWDVMSMDENQAKGNEDIRCVEKYA